MPSRLGRWIKKLRTARGLSQRDLGTRTGVTSAYITLLETGQRRNPTVLVAVRLADALGVPVMKLIECVIKDDEKPKRLNLADETVREKVRSVTTHAHLKQLFEGK